MRPCRARRIAARVITGTVMVFALAIALSGLAHARAATGTSQPSGPSLERLYTDAPPTGPAPLALEFHALASGTDPTATYSYKFDFGDGTDPVVTTDPVVSHTYDTAGGFFASVEMSDDAGVVGTETIEVVPVGPDPGQTLALSIDGGGIDYNQAEFAIGEDDEFTVHRDGFGVVSVKGEVGMPGLDGNGNAEATFDVARFWFLPFYAGGVRITDAGAGLDHYTPLILGSVRTTAEGITGRGWWFKPVPHSVFPRAYTLQFEVRNIEAGQTTQTVKLPPVCFSVVCIVGPNWKGGPNFVFTFDPLGHPQWSGTFVGAVTIEGFEIQLTGTVDDTGAHVSGSADLGPIVVGPAGNGEVSVTGTVYWGNKLAGITVTDPEGVAQQVHAGDFVLDATAELEFVVGTGFDLDASLQIARVGEPGWVEATGSITTGTSTELGASGFFEKTGDDVDYRLDASGDLYISGVTITGVTATVSPSGIEVSVAEVDVPSIDLKATDLAGSLSYVDGELASTISAGGISMGLNGYVILHATITVDKNGITVSDGSFSYSSADVNVSLDFSGTIAFPDGDVTFWVEASDATATIYDFPVKIGTARLHATVGTGETVIGLSGTELDIGGVTGSLDGQFDFQGGSGVPANLTGSLTVIVDGIEVDIPDFDMDAGTVDIDVYIPVGPDPQISEPDCSSQYICITGTMSYTGGGVNKLNIHLESTMPSFEWGPFNFEGSTVTLDTDVSSKGIDITDITISMTEGDLRINGSFNGSIYKAAGKNTLQVEIAAAKSPPLSVDYFGVPGAAIAGTVTDLELAGDVSFPDGLAEIDFKKASLKLGPLTAQFSGNVTFGDPVTYSLSAEMNPLPGGIPGSATFTLDNSGYSFDAEFDASFFTGDLSFEGTFDDHDADTVNGGSSATSAPVKGMPASYQLILENPITVTITASDVIAHASATLVAPGGTVGLDMSASASITATGITLSLSGGATKCGIWFNADYVLILGCMEGATLGLTVGWNAASEELSVSGGLLIPAFQGTFEAVIPLVAFGVSVSVDFTVDSNGNVPWYNVSCFTAFTPFPPIPFAICIPSAAVWALISALL